MTPPATHQPGEPEVKTAAGRVRGREEDGLTVFRGIPFAQPPVGEARFAAPGPVQPWDGVRDALEFGPLPPQATWRGMAPSVEVTGDEWLTLNVWTPDPAPAVGRPVMVWIYGGAYMMGTGAAPAYDGSRLAHEGDLVVVTFNYRVGVEGFAQISGAPANRGLLDQVAALEWVRDNIAAFGGDPDQVTVFGESAGAGSLASLLAMPRAKGLFRRAIVQSLTGSFFSPELAEDIASEIAAELGLSATVADLSGVDAGRLTAAGDAVDAKLSQYERRWGPVARSMTPFAPVVDGDVLPTTPWEALADGAAREVELIVGHNEDEYRMFLALGGLLGQVSDDQAADTLRALGPGPDAERAYRDAFPQASAEELYERVQSDSTFRMPTLRLAEAQVAGGGKAYVYELTWDAPGSDGIFGSTHFLDVPLVFGNLTADQAPVLLGPEPSAETEAISAHFRKAWTSFARTGDPGWPAFDAERRLVQVIDTEPTVTVYPEDDTRRLWQDHSFQPLPLLEK
ncbi:carboxylesterase/lipase family protein [Streptomyces sp. B21-083]|uniref:carboxylesterase/lipase family protein n=1 Tax=Streptomyces sp. B21-083 TaxID=3039410 RepID=UPI002FF1F7F3